MTYDTELDVLERTTAGQIRYSSLSDSELRQLFTNFKLVFNKQYDDVLNDDEEQLRYEVFKQNLYLCDERNAAEAAAFGDAVHGITKFSDMTDDEFASGYLLSFEERSIEKYSAYTADSSIPSSSFELSQEFLDSIWNVVSVDWTKK
jgi:hypothetical protein